MLTLDQYEALVTALRQRLNRKRVGRYRRLSEDAIRWRIDRALFPVGAKGEGQSLGHECDQCGACCRPFIINVTEADLDREPRLRSVVKSLPVVAPTEKRSESGAVICEPTGRAEIHQLASGPCPMQAGNACTIHATKPDVCRATPPGSFCCQYSRRQEGLPSLRPL